MYNLGCSQGVVMQLLKGFRWFQGGCCAVFVAGCC